MTCSASNKTRFPLGRHSMTCESFDNVWYKFTFKLYADKCVQFLHDCISSLKCRQPKGCQWPQKSLFRRWRAKWLWPVKNGMTTREICRYGLSLRSIFSQQSREHHRISDTNQCRHGISSHLRLPWDGQNLRLCGPCRFCMMLSFCKKSPVESPRD